MITEKTTSVPTRTDLPVTIAGSLRLLQPDSGAPWGAGGPTTDLDLSGLGGVTGPADLEAYDAFLCRADGPDTVPMRPTAEQSALAIRTLVEAGNKDAIVRALQDMTPEERQAMLVAYKSAAVIRKSDPTVPPLLRDLVVKLGSPGYDVYLNHAQAGLPQAQSDTVNQWIQTDQLELLEKQAKENKLKDVVWSVSQGKKEALRTFFQTLGATGESDFLNANSPKLQPLVEFSTTYFDKKRNISLLSRVPVVGIYTDNPANGANDYDPLLAVRKRELESPSPVVAKPPVVPVDVNPQQLAQQAKDLMAAPGDNSGQLNALLDRMTPAQRLEFTTHYAGIAGVRKEGEGEANAPTILWRRLTERYGDRVHDIWLNHAAKGAERQFGEVKDYMAKATPWTDGEFTAVHNFVNGLTPDERTAFLARYQTAAGHAFNGRLAERSADVTKAVLDGAAANPGASATRLNGLLDLMTPEQRQAMMGSFASRNRQGTEVGDAAVTDNTVFYRRLVDRLGGSGYDTFLNHTANGLKTPDGKEYQIAVMNQWLVGDEAAYGRHARKPSGATYTLVQGKREAIRTYLGTRFAQGDPVKELEGVRITSAAELQAKMGQGGNTFSDYVRENRLETTFAKMMVHGVFDNTTVTQLMVDPPPLPPIKLPPVAAPAVLPRPSLNTSCFPNGGNGNCIRCHDTGRRDIDLRSFDLGTLKPARGGDVDIAALIAGLPKAAPRPQERLIESAP
jgi:hypothetical protein